MLIDRH